MKLHFTFAALSLATLTFASAARAAPGADLPRVVVVLDETVDGKKATTTSAEVAVTASLNKDGYRLVSGEMAEKLRKAQAVSMALSGSVPDVLSSLDADVVILGQVEMTKIGSIPDAGLVGYRAAAVAKLVRVDTAQIVDAISIEAKGNDFTEAGAAQKAAQHVGDELAKAIKTSIAANAKKAHEIDLVVHGLPDRSSIDAVKAGLAKARGVSSVTVRQSGKGISKIELTTTSDAEALATDLEKGGLPLEIVQTSSASILARYDIKRGVKLGAVLLAPTVKLAARGAWVQGVLPKLVAAELENVAWVDVVETGAHDVDLALDASGADKENVALTITAQDPSSKSKLFTASGTGKLEDLPGLVSQVVKKLDDGFLPAVARGHAAPSNTALARAAAAGKTKPVAVAVDVPELKIDSLKLENLFPAKLGYYSEHPVGSIVVEHSDAKGAAATDVSVSIYVPRFMQLKSDVAVGTVNPGEKKEIPLKVTLDNATVFSIEENTPTQAEVVVDYTVAGGKMQSRRVAPLIVYGKRAIDWSESASVTAFVTPSDENVRNFAHAALVDGDKTLPQPMNDAVALFAAMSQAQLRYVKDPTVPARTAILDTVQFPRETLSIKTGDCDDLSALYASLLESVGVETSFLLVPGHVLVGVATGLPPDGLDRLTLDSGKVLVRDGKVWVPVETTFLGKSFRDAWAEGARTVERASKSAGPDGLVVVETRAGWDQYPPAALPKAIVAVAKPDPKTSGAQAEVAAVVGERDGAVKTKMDALAAVLAKNPGAPEANTYAAMLAKRGDVDKAAAVLKAALAKLTASSPAALEVSNNLANVDVLSGNSAGAVEKYRAILDKVGPKRGDVLTNLGIAYTLAGDQAHAVEAFDAALAAGASSAYIATGFERAPKNAPVAVTTTANRADDATSTTVAEQELKSILSKALEQRKKQAQDEQKAGQKPKPVEADRFANPLPSGARRGDDAQSKLRTAELLRWLS
jgi:tetratricopeptide (TPR) repeat protein